MPLRGAALNPNGTIPLQIRSCVDFLKFAFD